MKEVCVFGKTLLFTASRKGDFAVVEALVLRGAAVDEVDDAGSTPLFVAAKNGHAEVVEILLARGADVDKEN